MQEIITRFAPSPTGFLHIGGARTAIYNYLFAKKHGGKYLLRVEDTDKKRSTDEAVDAILSGLAWLGIQHDGDVIFQSSRQSRHQDAAKDLLAKGMAYKCYCTPLELDAMREQAQQLGKTALYDGTWRDRDDSDMEAAPYTVRLKVNRDNPSIDIVDMVQGEVSVLREHIDDFVLLRSDGSPTYMLSVVVDDLDMGISHVIRGSDHLTNSFRQVALYEALAMDVPAFAHIGLLHGSDGKKLSKRHGALGIEAYREFGFLPSVLVRYLAGIGCAGLDNVALDEMSFEIERLSRSAAQFDMEKLSTMNAEEMRSCDSSVLFDLTATLLAQRYKTFDEDRYVRGIPILVKRSKTLIEMVDNAEFFIGNVNNNDVRDQLKDHKSILKEVYKTLDGIAEQDWQPSLLQDALKGLAEEQQLSFGKIGKPLRIALTGAPASPGDLSEVLMVFGKIESLERIANTLVD